MAFADIRPVDVALIGAGNMSSTLAALLWTLEPNLSVARLDARVVDGRHPILFGPYRGSHDQGRLRRAVALQQRESRARRKRRGGNVRIKFVVKTDS